MAANSAGAGAIEIGQAGIFRGSAVHIAAKDIAQAPGQSDTAFALGAARIIIRIALIIDRNILGHDDIAAAIEQSRDPICRTV